jgi:DNA polymerase-1
MIWPTQHPWTGDLVKDKALAESIKFDALHDIRYMSKQSGHASNYLITAYTLAMNLKIAQVLTEQFQSDYFGRFVGIRRWHAQVNQLLQTLGYLITPLGRKRVFFGRRWDDATLREAVAQNPQSVVADILNIGMVLVWQEFDLPDRGLQLLMQVHDAILTQYLETREDLVEKALELMTIAVPVGDKVMRIPVEAQVGYNWKDLAVLGSEEASKQRRTEAPENFLDRVICPED